MYLHPRFTVTLKVHAPATRSNSYAFATPFLPKASAGKKKTTTGVSSQKIPVTHKQ